MQTYQILTNDEGCIPSLSSILLAVSLLSGVPNNKCVCLDLKEAYNKKVHIFIGK